MDFPVAYAHILDRIGAIDPVAYGRSRNYLDGAVTYLSPYISRGVISTRQVLESILAAGYEPSVIEKFIQELAWRDYWQQLWIAHGSKIDADLKQAQPYPTRVGIPSRLVEHETGIAAIDQGVAGLYGTGYLHNHLRMYVAALACNLARCHWQAPAQWMYYHLRDGDWASNALSWQWVCGANSHKLYFANQENINQYCRTEQHGTFLDVTYEALAEAAIPAELEALTLPHLQTPLPQVPEPVLDPALPTLIYNYYNLDPQWRSDLVANRVLLLEPSVFARYPVSQKCIDFCINLAQANIPGIQVYVAEFVDLQAKVNGDIYYKEHPLNRYRGHEDARTWLSSVRGDFPSFFAFWKQCKRELL